MPHSDPIPPQPSIAARFRRLLRRAAALSAVVAGIAMLLVQRGDEELHLHMLIATGVGVFLTMLLGTGLMSLMFLSHHSGHDSAAADFKDER